MSGLRHFYWQVEGTDDSSGGDLPPWLREDSPAEPPPEAERKPLPKLGSLPAGPRSSPPPPPPLSPEDEAVPPWLRENAVKSVDESRDFSQDWLANADALPETIDTELTYDEWALMQAEIKRPKSVEEEIPDLFTGAPPAAEAPAAGGTGALEGTGELPDWFLGLEELDTSEAPDWFTGTGTGLLDTNLLSKDNPISPSAPTTALTPPKQSDAIESFFASLQSEPVYEEPEAFNPFEAAPQEAQTDEELPDLDWVASQPYEEPPSDDSYTGTEMDAFFRSLSTQTAAAATGELKPPPGMTIEPETPREATEPVPAVSDADFDAETPAKLRTDQLPEVDWFAAAGLGAAATADQSDIDEPELDQIFSTAQAINFGEDDEDDEPYIPEAPIADAPIDDNTMSWLSELQGIVASATGVEADEPETADAADFYAPPLDLQTEPATVDDELPLFDLGLTAEEETPEGLSVEPLEYVDSVTTADTYDWEAVSAAEIEAEGEEDALAAWVDAIDEDAVAAAALLPDSDESDESLLADSPLAPVTPSRPALSGILNRAALGETLEDAFEPPPEPEHAEDPLAWMQGMDIPLAPPTVEEIQTAGEQELDSVWMMESLFEEAPQVATPAPVLPDDEAFPSLSFDALIEPTPEPPPVSEELPTDFSFDELAESAEPSYGMPTPHSEYDKLPEDISFDAMTEGYEPSHSESAYGSAVTFETAASPEPLDEVFANFDPDAPDPFAAVIASQEMAKVKFSGEEELPADISFEELTASHAATPSLNLYEKPGMTFEEVTGTLHDPFAELDTAAEAPAPAQAEAAMDDAGEVDWLEAMRAEVPTSEMDNAPAAEDDSHFDALAVGAAGIALAAADGDEEYTTEMPQTADIDWLFAMQAEGAVNVDVPEETPAQSAADLAAFEQSLFGSAEPPAPVGDEPAAVGAEAAWLADDLFENETVIEPAVETAAADMPTADDAAWLTDDLFEGESSFEPAVAAQTETTSVDDAAWLTDDLFEGEPSFEPAVAAQSETTPVDEAAWLTDDLIEAELPFEPAAETAAADMPTADNAAWLTDDLIEAELPFEPADDAMAWLGNDLLEENTLPEAAALEVTDMPDAAFAEPEISDANEAPHEDTAQGEDAASPLAVTPDLSGSAGVGEIFAGLEVDEDELIDDEADYPALRDPEPELPANWLDDDMPLADFGAGIVAMDALNADGLTDGDDSAAAEGLGESAFELNPVLTDDEAVNAIGDTDFLLAADAALEADNDPDDDWLNAMSMNENQETESGDQQPLDGFAELPDLDSEPTFENPDTDAAAELPADELPSDDFFMEFGMAEIADEMPAESETDAANRAEQGADLDWLGAAAVGAVGGAAVSAGLDDQPEADLFSQWMQTDSPEQPADLFAAIGQADAVAQDAEPAAEWGSFDFDGDDQPDENADLFADLGGSNMLPQDSDALSEWGDLDTLAAGEADGGEPDSAVPAPDAWLADYAAEEQTWSESFTEPEPPAAEEPQFEDIDSYLKSLKLQTGTIKPITHTLLEPDAELESLLTAPEFEEDNAVAGYNPYGGTQAFDPNDPEIAALAAADTPDWLSDVSVGEVSATAMVRQRKDKDVDDLDERLKKLRRRSDKQASSAAPAAQDDALAGIVGSAAGGLTAANIGISASGKSGGTGTLSLTTTQQTQAVMLSSMVATATGSGASTGEKTPSAIDETFESAYLPELEDDDEHIVYAPKDAAAAAEKPRRARRRSKVRVDRILIIGLIIIAVLVPFFLRDARVGDLPPTAFPAGSQAQAVFDQIEALPPGAVVLVGMEYGAGSAPELDGLADGLLRHILMRNAYPIIISGNPTTLLRAEIIMDQIANDPSFLDLIGADEPLQANRDYYLISFLPGGQLGLRAFSENTAQLVANDLSGQVTGLNVNSLRDFAEIVIIADRAEDIRAYAEQIAPLAQAPIVGAVNQASAPLAQSYAAGSADSAGTNGNAPLSGLLIGIGDAYTYNTLIGNVPQQPIESLLTSILPEATGEATAAADDQTPLPSPTAAIPTPAAQIVPRDDSRPAPLLFTPSSTPLPPTSTPTSTPTPTLTPTPVVGVIVSNQPVNLREQPSIEAPIIQQINPGTQVTVIGFSGEEEWANVRLSDGTVGWVSATLVQLGAGASVLPHDSFARRYVAAQQDTPEGEASVEASSTPRPTRTPRASATPSPSRTPRRTATNVPAIEQVVEVTGDVTPEVTAAPLPPPSPGLREERWYALTAGILVSSVIIGAGAVINIGRAIGRRRKSR